MESMSEYRGFEPGGWSQDTPGSETSGRVREPRIVPVDNLKSLLVAWIIACHALGATQQSVAGPTTRSPR